MCACYELMHQAMMPVMQHCRALDSSKGSAGMQFVTASANQRASKTQLLFTFLFNYFLTHYMNINELARFD